MNPEHPGHPDRSERDSFPLFPFNSFSPSRSSRSFRSFLTSHSPSSLQSFRPIRCLRSLPSLRPAAMALLAGGATFLVACGDDPLRVHSSEASSVAQHAQLPLSECDSAEAEWLWCDDFEENRLSGYFGYNDAGGDFTRTAGVGVSGGYGMRARWEQGDVSVGTLQLGIGRNPAAGAGDNVQGDAHANYREIYWRMYVRTQPGWTGGSGHKLNRATVLAGSDWQQAMIAHVWGGGESELVIDPASGTDTEGNLITDRYNDFENLRWLGLRRGTTPIFEDARAGIWQCVEARARLNSAGQSDGVFQMWINGVLEASRTDLNWLGSYTAYGINAVFFENYWNGGSPASQERYFDNIVVSTAPIGCLDEEPADPGEDLPDPDDSEDPGDSTDPGNDDSAAGLTLITDRSFNALGDDGWGYNGSSHFSIVEDPSAIESPGSIGQARYPAGFNGGSGPITTWKSFGDAGYTELRTTQWVKVSNNFYGHPSGVNKVLHFWVDGGNRAYTSMQGTETGLLRPQLRLQGVNEPSEASRVNLGQNVSTGSTFSFQRGEWHKWEIYLRSNTDGAGNGVVKMWIDGELLAEYTDVNFVPAGRSTSWEHVYWAPTWGGTGSTVPETMYMWTDHLRAQGGQGTAGGGSGGDNGSGDDGAGGNDGSGDDGAGDDGGSGGDDGSGDDGAGGEDDSGGDDGTGDDDGSDGDDGSGDDSTGDDGGSGGDDGSGNDNPDKEKKPKGERGRSGFPRGLPAGFPHG